MKWVLMGVASVAVEVWVVCSVGCCLKYVIIVDGEWCHG